MLCLLALCFEGNAYPRKQIVAAGPIRKITVGEDGSLQIEHQNFPEIGQFFPKTVAPADCGFFLRHNGKVVGIDYARHEATAAANTRAIPFRSVSQIQSTDGLLVRNVMDNSFDGTEASFLVTQYVSYFPGDAWFSVDITVKNQGASAQTVDLFAAADIYLADEDEGYGSLKTDCPQAAIGGANLNRTFSAFVQAASGGPLPVSYQEDYYASIWAIIGNGIDFANTASADYLDNGAGLEWQDVTIPAGGSFAVRYYWAFGSIPCVEITPRAEQIHVLWPGGTNMILRWDQPGYLLQGANGIVNHEWETLPAPITTNEVTIDIDLQGKVFFRLIRP